MNERISLNSVHEIKKLPMVRHHHGDKEEPRGKSLLGGKKSHLHAGLDPHVWLSPPLVMSLSRIILTTLQDLDPRHRQVYEANYADFIKETVTLDADLRKTFIDQQGLKFMVFHPSWGYFADTYGLTQIPIEIEGKEPKPAQLAKLIKSAREEHIRAVFVQPQFSTKSAEQISKTINGQVIVADPLALDWPESLRSIADRIRSSNK